MVSNEQSRRVQAVGISLAIIEALQEHGGAGVTKLANELGYSKGTIHSHLTTLLEHEYVVRDEGIYRLSLRFLDLGESAIDRINGYDAVVAELDDLASESGELAQFATHEHGQIVYLYKTEGERAVQTASSIGMREYMHCTALGKAILSTMSEERIDEIIDMRGLPEFTEQTITTPEMLYAELKEIRQQGYAFDEEEMIEGLRCVGTLIQAIDGRTMGAISVSGPSSRMQGTFYREKLPSMLTRSANVIEINTKFS